MDFSQLRMLMAYVGFGDDAAAILRAVHPHAEPVLGPIVGDFYAAIERHAEARAVFSGGETQVERLKATLVQWLHSVLLGPYDEAYLHTHSRIGRVHVRINLPQEFMFSAMDRIRNGLLTVIDDVSDPELNQLEAVRAVNQILDIELAIMLDTYREDWMRRVQANERLATIGQLAASIGHELRNPLGVMQTSLFLVLSRMAKLGVSDPSIEKHLGRIGAQVGACAGTISSLLEMARDAPLRARNVLLGPLVEQCISDLTPPSDITFEIVDAGVFVYADPQQLQRVLSNLLDNAVRALKGRGRVRVSAREAPDGTEFFVEDDGPGVEPSVRDKIFDVLFTTRSSGTGLGLALCRKIIDKHRGELSLVEREAAGACFRIWLPRVEPDETSAASD
jgi:signal transduction histidine kinase